MTNSPNKPNDLDQMFKVLITAHLADVLVGVVHTPEYQATMLVCMKMAYAKLGDREKAVKLMLECQADALRKMADTTEENAVKLLKRLENERG